ncbi:non-specific lipid-transfer protein 2-like [Cornus florida]|uniref:non-specific lipid-transfer protein 2-like n=1 Tax=Cornus florida TaxID=4283 RepID=UPI00289DB3A6|nr:non-specific lipid-transfer protein 2-like [Cornus florida]
MKMSYIAVVVCAMVVLLLGGAEVCMAVTCNPTELSPCAAAITSSNPPTATCCSKLKEQRPCLCQYVKNPNLQKFVNSPNARKVATTCGSPFPNC